MIPIYKPYLTKESLRHAHDAIDSGWVSSIGKYKELATNKIKEMTGSRNVLLLSNGTCAVHLCAISLKYRYPNIKKLVTSNNVYIAAINGFLYDRNAWEIIAKDIDASTWNIKYEDIKDDIETAYIIVNNVGNIFNVPVAKKLAPNSIFIEDNCEGFGGMYGNFHSGTQSFCSSMSFFGNKNITCGEGGAFYTDDDDIFEYITRVQGQGQTNERYIHDIIGYNYRMTNVQAALLLGQLECFNEIKELKEDIFRNFRKEFESRNIKIQKVEDGTTHSNWFFGVTIPGSTYDVSKKFLSDNGVETRPMFYPLSRHSHLNGKVIIDSENVSKVISKTSFMIPSYPELNKEEINHIINKITELRDFYATSR